MKKFNQRILQEKYNQSKFIIVFYVRILLT